MKPRLVVIEGGRGPESDPRRRPDDWNCDWTPGQHGGSTFTTDTAHVDLTSPTHGASAAVRDAANDQRLQLQVWTARVEEFPTEEAAYFARDEELIRSADRVIEFWDGRSTGTAHELDYAWKLGKPVDLVVLPIDQPRRSLKSPSPDPFPGGDAA